MRWFVSFVVLFSGSLLGMFAQDNPGKTKTVTTTCNFQDGKQISVRYERLGLTKKNAELPRNEIWPASGSPMYLFTQTALSAGDAEIAPGAYSMYVIPEKEKWTLIINKGVTAGAPYDQQQDLLRLPMPIGHLSESQSLKVAFGHVAPKQCNLRIYYGKTGTWAEFKEM